MKTYLKTILFSILVSLRAYSQDTVTTFDGLINKGIQVKNQKQGVWLSFDKQQRLRQKRTYVNGVLNGPAISWNYQTNDTLITKGDYKNGNPVGTWTSSNRFAYSTIEYLSDKKTKTTGYAFGKISFVNYYNDKTPIGIWLRYNASGQKSREIPFKNGVIDGKVITYNSSGGKILAETTYVNGKEGETKCWDENGNPDKTCSKFIKGMLFPYD